MRTDRGLASLDVMKIALALIVTVGLVTIAVRAGSSGKSSVHGASGSPSPPVTSSAGPAPTTPAASTPAPTPSTPTPSTPSPSTPSPSPTATGSPAGSPLAGGGTAAPPPAPLPTVSGGTGSPGPTNHLAHTGGSPALPLIALALLAVAAPFARRVTPNR